MIKFIFNKIFKNIIQYYEFCAEVELPDDSIYERYFSLAIDIDYERLISRLDVRELLDKADYKPTFLAGKKQSIKIKIANRTLFWDGEPQFFRTPIYRSVACSFCENIENDSDEKDFSIELQIAWGFLNVYLRPNCLGKNVEILKKVLIEKVPLFLYSYRLGIGPDDLFCMPRTSEEKEDEFKNIRDFGLQFLLNLELYHKNFAKFIDKTGDYDVLSKDWRDDYSTLYTAAKYRTDVVNSNKHIRKSISKAIFKFEYFKYQYHKSPNVVKFDDNYDYVHLVTKNIEVRVSGYTSRNSWGIDKELVIKSWKCPSKVEKKLKKQLLEFMDGDAKDKAA